MDTSQDPCENFYDFASMYLIQAFIQVLNILYVDGGWLKAHPVPSDKGVYGNFEAVSQQNRRVLQEILSSDSSVLFASAKDSYDHQILSKLRGLYSSCMDEDKLNEIGTQPLARVTSTIRNLFNGETTVVHSASSDKHEKVYRERLTATVAYLHSRG